MLKRSSWMSGKAGVMMHYVPLFVEGVHGEKYTNVDDCVNAFDVPAFIEQFKKLNAEWLIFTIGQNTGLFNAPNKTLEARVGAGHCAKRDLVGELAQAVHDCGKRFMTYLPIVMYGNPIREQVFFKPWTDEKPIHRQEKFQALWNRVIEEWSLRYGKLLDGWFFDGGYGIIPTAEDRTKFFAAVRAGNPDSAVSVNFSGLDIWDVPLMDPDEDYFSGETTLLKDGLPLTHWRERGDVYVKHLGIPPSEDAYPKNVLYEPESSTAPGFPETLMHTLVPIDAFWIRKEGVDFLKDYPDSRYLQNPGAIVKDGEMEPPMYSRAQIERLLKAFCGKGAAVTLNMGVFANGTFGKESVKLLDGLLNR